LFTSERIIRQSDRNYRPAAIKLTYPTFWTKEQLDRSFSVSSRDGHGPPVAGPPTPSRESSEVRWTAATALFGCAISRSMRIRINDVQTRNELAGFWNGKSWKLVTTV
jgi:hypothetical protein